MKRRVLSIYARCFAMDTVLFIALCATLLQGITSFKLLNFATSVRALSWSVAVFALLGAFRAWASRGVLRYTAGLWAISGLTLIAQMAWFHILI